MSSFYEEKVQFRDPDDFEIRVLSRIHQCEGLRECLRVRHPCVARKLVKDTELERHALPGAALSRTPALGQNHIRCSRWRNLAQGWREDDGLQIRGCAQPRG